jgi:hypothetical protein
MAKVSLQVFSLSFKKDDNTYTSPYYDRSIIKHGQNSYTIGSMSFPNLKAAKEFAYKDEAVNEISPEASLNKVLIKTVNIRGEEVKIYTVNPNYVNIHYKDKFPDAKEWHSGGHAKGWQTGMEFIPGRPKPEIWLDQNADKVALNSYLLHEVFEFDKMFNEGMEYDPAHKLATELETKYKEQALKSDNPDELLEQYLKAEVPILKQAEKNEVKEIKTKKASKNYYLSHNRDRLLEELDYETKNLIQLREMEQTPIIKAEVAQTEHTLARINKRLKQKPDMNTDKSNDKPSAETKSRFSPVKEVDRNEIITMPELFQGRQKAFSEESVAKIVSEGFDKSNDPIIVWYSPEKSKYVVISGHSRWEASRILYEQGDKSLQTMPVKVFLGDQEEAVSYAVLESNRASTAEGLISDVKAVKKMMAEGYNKTEMLKYVKPQSYLEKIISYTYLNENGSFIEQLGSDAKVSFPYLERNAQWIGYLRKSYWDKLTNQHEKEIFDFLYTSGARESLRMTKENLFKIIDKKIMAIDFDSSKPLNLKNIVSTSGVINPVKSLIKEVEDDIKYFNDERDKKMSLIARAQAEHLDAMIPEFQEYIKQADAKLLELHEKKLKLESEMKRMERETIVDLFSEFSEKSPSMVRIENEMILQEATEAENEGVQDAEQKAIKCNADLFDFAKKYSKEILQLDDNITIGVDDCQILKIDSEKITFARIAGKYDTEPKTIMKGYDELIDLFSKGRVIYGTYTHEDKTAFDLMVQNKQKCILYEESHNDLKNVIVRSVDKITAQHEKLKELETATAEQSAELEIKNRQIEKINNAKEIAVKVREYLKEKYPNFKFSVKSDYNHLNIVWVSGNIYPFIDGNLSDYEKKGLNVTLNRYSIAENIKFTPEAKEILIDVDKYSNQWNWDKSDPMTDYFDINYYFNFSVGKWDKPYEYNAPVIIEPTPEKLTKETVSQKIKAFKTLSKLTKDSEKKKLYEQKIKGFNVLLKTIKN